MEIDTRDLILKIFKANSLLEEIPASTVKDCLLTFTKEYDLPIDFFDLYLKTLSDKNYLLNDVSHSLSLPLTEILRTLKTLQKIVEGCFAFNNLKNNLKLRNLISEAQNGYVSLGTFIKYKNIKALTSSEVFLAKALEDSSLLEISFDRKNVRLQVPLKSSEQDIQLFYYNLDTSQGIITYSSIAEGLNLKPNLSFKNKYVTLVAGNSRIVCYFKPDCVHRVDLANGEDKIIGQAKGLCYIEIKNNEDLLVGIIEKIKIIVVDLRISQQIFEYKVIDGQVEKVVFHPTEKNLLGRFTSNEIVLFKYTQGKNNELNWYKVIPVKQKIINIALISNLLAAAIGQGQIQIINTDTDSVILTFSPHTYNTMMYSSIITLHFINSSFLLTSGRSQNEFCLTNLETKEKSHVLSIQSLSKKQISVVNDCILINDPISSNISLVIMTEIDNNLKFSKICDYKLDTNCSLACLNSISTFVAATKTDVRVYFTNIEPKTEEKLVYENSMESSEIISSVSSFLNGKTKLISEKITQYSKLSGLKKTLTDSISENIDKAHTKHQKIMQDEIKKLISDNTLKAFQGGLEEMLGQIFSCAETGIKEFADKESELDSIHESLQKENYAKISLITDFTDIYTKTCMKKVKKLEKVEEGFREKLMTLKSKEPCGILEKVNILLAQGEYDLALSMVLQNPKKLYAVLAVINPYGLLQAKKISNSLHWKIIKQFLLFPPTSKQLINSAE